MYAPINFFEIVSDYYAHMKKDLKPIPFIITLIISPFILATIFFFIVGDKKEVYGNFVTVSAILIPLLLNLLMIVYYSLEKTERQKKTKIEYLEHLNSTISMTTLTAIFVLILSLILLNLDSNPLFFEFLLFYAIGFLIVNVIMSLVRVYRLIRHEIREKVISNEYATK